MKEYIYSARVGETDTQVYCPVCKGALFTLLTTGTGYSNGLCCTTCKYKLMFDSLDLRPLVLSLMRNGMEYSLLSYGIILDDRENK